MANQVNDLHEHNNMFETFKQEMTDILKSLFDNQNIMRQELFLLRNKLSEFQAQPAELPAAKIGQEISKVPSVSRESVTPSESKETSETYAMKAKVPSRHSSPHSDGKKNLQKSYSKKCTACWRLQSEEC